MSFVLWKTLNDEHCFIKTLNDEHCFVKTLNDEHCFIKTLNPSSTTTSWSIVHWWTIDQKEYIEILFVACPKVVG
jgi:hypothetical protein